MNGLRSNHHNTYLCVFFCELSSENSLCIFCCSPRSRTCVCVVFSPLAGRGRHWGREMIGGWGSDVRASGGGRG